MTFLQVHGLDVRIELVPGQRVTIGRSHSNDVRVMDKSISHNHASIEWTGDSAVLRDLDSHNGTWIGSEKVKEVVLTPGAEFKLGAVVLRVVDPNAPAPPVQAAPPPPETAATPPSPADPVPAAVSPAQPAAEPPAPSPVGSSPGAPPPPSTLPARRHRVLPLLVSTCVVGAALGVAWWSGRPIDSTPPADTDVATATDRTQPTPGVPEAPAPSTEISPRAALDPFGSPLPEKTSSPSAAPVEPASPAAPQPEAPLPSPAVSGPSPLAPLVGQAVVVALKSGSLLEGTLLSEDPSRIVLAMDVDRAHLESPIAIEDVAKVNDVVVQADLARIFSERYARLAEGVQPRIGLMHWCAAHGLEAERLKLAAEVVALRPEHEEARLVLGQRKVGDEWLTEAQIAERGLVRYEGQWLTPDERKRRGLVEVDGEWMTPEQKLTREGMVKFGDRWVTKEDAKQLRRGYVSYLGVWIPAPLAWRLMMKDYYELALRSLRTAKPEDRDTALAGRVAFHLRKVEEVLGRRPSNVEASAEEVRFRRIADQACALDDKAFETKAKTLASECEYRPPQEREDLRRMADPWRSTIWVADVPELQGLVLLNALEFEDHQVWHLLRLSERFNAIREETHESALKLDRVAKKNLERLREETAEGVNRGFDVPPSVEGPAAAAEHAVIALMDGFQKQLIDAEGQAWAVLSEDQKSAAGT